MAHCSYSAESKPSLIMVTEPETNCRFRYESERGSHGGLTGKEKIKDKKTYPTVKLMNYSGSYKDIFIRLSLYTRNRTEHVFSFKKLKSPEIQDYVDEKLMKDFTAEFRNLSIISKKREEVHEVLMNRRVESLRKNLSKTARDKFEKDNIEAVKKEAKEILNSVVLCFDAFENCRPDVQICCSLYSEPIWNENPLKICRMSKVSGSWKGDEEVILLCSKVNKDNIKILFFEYDVEDGWKAYASFKPSDVHFQVAIPFRTPQYKENVERTVAVALERQGELSEPRFFTYIPEDCPSKKRKTCAPDVLSSSVNISFPCSSTAALADDSSQQIMLTPECSQTKVQPPQLDSAEIPSSVLGSMFSDMELGNILDIISSEDYLNYIDGNLKSDNESEAYHVNQVYTDGPVLLITKDRQKDIQKLEAQMAVMEFGDPSSSYKITNPSYKEVSKKAQITETLKEKLEKYLSLIFIRDKMGEYTALHIAVEKNAFVVKDLLMSGGNPNIKNAEGNNCYHIAAQNNYDKCMLDLLKYSQFLPELSNFNYEGLTPLHIALKKNSPACFNILKNHEADLRAKEQKCGRSLLHYAVEFQPNFILPILEEGDIDVNIKDFEGSTPLHIACAIGNYDIVQQLLSAGADPSVRNFKQSFLDSEEDSDNEIPFGQTPSDLTTNSKILELLNQASKEYRSVASDILDSCSGTEEIMKILCKLLDPGMRWKDVAIYVLDESYIDNLKCCPSPTKGLLEYLKKNMGEGYTETLKEVLKMAGFNDAAQIIEESSKPLTVL